MLTAIEKSERKVIGCLTVKQRSRMKNTLNIELCNLCVAKQYRRRKVASMLLQYADDLSVLGSPMNITTLSIMEDAKLFYLSQGFSVVKEEQCAAGIILIHMSR